MDEKEKKPDELQRLLNACMKHGNLQSDEILKISRELDILIVEDKEKKSRG